MFLSYFNLYWQAGTLIIIFCSLLLIAANGLGQSQSGLANRQFIYGGFDANAFTNIKAGYGYTHFLKC